MATPILDGLNIELSHKIFDPIGAATEDGQIFSAFLRASYLNRAYSRLVRTLEIVHPDINEVVTDYYSPLSITLGEELPDEADVLEFYYKPNSRGKLTKSKKITPLEYFSVKAGRDSFYTPSINERFWTKINNKIEVLPEDTALYFEPQVMTKQNFLLLDGTKDITVPAHYYDLLLNMAALEATADRGDWQTYQIYANSISNELALIARLKAEVKK